MLGQKVITLSEFHCTSLAFGACPPSYDAIFGKCYAHHKDSKQNRDVADNLCVSANAHLWIVNDPIEFELVTKFYGLQKVRTQGHPLMTSFRNKKLINV